MSVQRQEIKSLIVACEHIQAVMAKGYTYSDEEQALIAFCVNELLSKMPRFNRRHEVVHTNSPKQHG